MDSMNDTRDLIDSGEARLTVLNRRRDELQLELRRVRGQEQRTRLLLELRDIERQLQEVSLDLTRCASLEGGE